MTITQIRKKYGGMEFTRLSTGELVFKVDDNHVRLVKLEELLSDKDFWDRDLGVFETPIVCISNNAVHVGNEHNSNEVIADEYKTWISAKHLQEFLNEGKVISGKKTQNTPIVKVCKLENEFAFLDDVNNCVWCFYLDFPDLETLKISETHFNDETEKFIKKNAKELPKDLAITFINNYNVKNNRLSIYNILTNTFNIDEAELDKIFNRDIEAFEILNEAIDQYSKEKGNDIRKNYTLQYNLENLYRFIVNQKQYWDKDRLIAYLLKRKIKNELIPALGRPYIDIFGECHPTKYSLLYEFYNCSKEDEAVMDEAVELYPDINDIDKAYYYFIEKLKELNKLK